MCRIAGLCGVLILSGGGALALAGDVSPCGPVDEGPAYGAIRAALYDAQGSGSEGPGLLAKILGQKPGIEVVRIGPKHIHDGELRQYQVVIFPGGSASQQAAAIGEDGRRRVQRFIAAGGGYLGICAGAYLAASGYSWSLGILNAKAVEGDWRRGTGTVQIEFTAQGRQLLGGLPGRQDIHYENGPILMPAGVPTLPEYQVLAVFRTEMAENNTPVGAMVNSPAFLAGRFGQGRVVCFSPHPEQSRELEFLIRRAVEWAADKNPAVAARAQRQ